MRIDRDKEHNSGLNFSNPIDRRNRDGRARHLHCCPAETSMADEAAMDLTSRP